MKQKPSIPKGTRDFLPFEVARRNYIFDTIKSSFKNFGFLPIETPSFELSSTLMGKYGEEGDRLIFRILNSGDYTSKYKILISVVLNNIIKESIKNVHNELVESGIQKNEKTINYLLSDKFEQYLIESLKKDNNVTVKNFLNNEFELIVKNEISLINNSSTLKVQIIQLLRKCIDCDPLENNEIQNYINLVTNQIIGRWFREMPTKHLTYQISEKALRYDLTVPFARFVVQHQNELSFPFKRYQIQPVWRADRPQHGRYQEFFQCDADVVGSDSLLYEVDFIQLFDEVLSNLQLPAFTIYINNRKILSGIAEVSGESDRLIDITVALDKLDKIGEEGVIKELHEKGVAESSIERIKPLLTMTGSNQERIEAMKTYLATSEIGLKGIEELVYVIDTATKLGLEKANLVFDVTLARGLNYYTGAIFEVKADGVKMGSICGGGRYDNLTDLFGMPNMSGVGISFGADRIYDVLKELELFPKEVEQGLEVLFVNFGAAEEAYCLPLVKDIRKNGISCELYPTKAKMQKQMKYANDVRVKYVAIVGEEEMANEIIQLKNMETGEQEEMSVEELIVKIKK